MTLDVQMKIAYCCEPQVGGTYSFFRRIRPELMKRGIEMRCIPPISGEKFKGSRFENEEGVDYVTFPDDNLPEASRILIDHLQRNEFDAILILPGCDWVCTNLVRYLPRTIRAAARVPMITRGTYAPTQALNDHLDMVFGVSHRVAEDLTASYGMSEDKIRVIYNGVEERPVLERREKSQEEPFTVLYSGRLSDLDKGVMLLPEIMTRLVSRGVNAKLVVIGASGPDRDRFHAAIKLGGLNDRVSLLGNVSMREVEEQLANADCFVLPSRFEGCPNAMLEAMASGVACVAARIRGSVDRIVEDGKNGVLAEIADPESFADGIAGLAANKELREEIGARARETILKDYSIEKTASLYAEGFEALIKSPDLRAEQLSLDHYSIPRAMKPTWRTRIPVPIKNMARKWMERMGMSS